MRTVATSPSSFLRYTDPTEPTFEVLEVEIRFPSPQAPNVFAVGGLISNWNGSNSSTAGPSVAAFHFTTDGAGNVVPGSSRFVVESFLGGDQVSFLYPAFALDTYSKVRLVKTIKQTAVYIDDGAGFVLIGQSFNSGSVAGEFVGTWAFQATAEFKNFKSWSALILPQL